MLEESIEAVVCACRVASGNPSSLHWAGRKSRKIVDDARDLIARYLKVEPGSVVFTSGGTEANNMAIYGVLSSCEPGTIVTSAIEHPAVLQPMERWGQEPGCALVVVRPSLQGEIDAIDFCAQISRETRMVAIMLANNETGVIQPVQAIVDHCRGLGVPVLVDAVQALGKISLDLKKLDADFVSLSAHKIGGPKGVGALIVRKGAVFQPLMLGGGQERKRRSGTENVAAIAGFSAALQSMDFTHVDVVRNHFEQMLLAAFDDVTIFGRDALRLGNTSMFSVPGIDGETLLMQLDLAGFAVASGSACSSGKRQPSHVLCAMGVAQSDARSSLRISFGGDSTLRGAEALVQALQQVRERMKKLSGWK
ncbi:MAG: cysteine desulfurase [Zetaproteobacteria bacterium]|nr:cysteine desulfurase [Zetaproteobacteria bacterium]